MLDDGSLRESGRARGEDVEELVREVDGGGGDGGRGGGDSGRDVQVSRVPEERGRRGVAAAEEPQLLHPTQL